MQAVSERFSREEIFAAVKMVGLVLAVTFATAVTLSGFVIGIWLYGFTG